MIGWSKKLPKERLAIFVAAIWAFIGYALLGGVRFSLPDQALSFGPLVVAIIYYLIIRMRREPNSDRNIDD